MTHLPWPSITRAPRGTFVVVAGPTALMRLPAMITVRSEELAAAPSSSGCTTVAPTMAVRVPPAGLAARGSASDTVAAAPQSAAASTVWQQRNRDMAAPSRITLPPTVAPARPGARGFFRHLARVPFRHVSVNSATSPRHSRFDASGWFLRCARDVGKPEEVMVGMCMFYSLLLTQGLRLPKGPPATGSGSLQFSLPHVRAHTRDVIVVQIREPGSCDFTIYDPAVSLQRGAYSRFLSLAGALRVGTPCAGAGHG